MPPTMTPEDPAYAPKTLILCFDGTTNQYDDDVRSLCPTLLPTENNE